MSARSVRRSSDPFQFTFNRRALQRHLEKSFEEEPHRWRKSDKGVACDHWYGPDGFRLLAGGGGGVAVYQRFQSGGWGPFKTYSEFRVFYSSQWELGAAINALENRKGEEAAGRILKRLARE